MTLEQKIMYKIRRCRILLGSVVGILFVFFIVFLGLYYDSYQLETIGSGFLAIEKESYNHAYAIISVLCLFASFWAGAFWLGSFACRCVSTKCNADTILVHRGLFSNHLYINEMEADQMVPLSFKYFMEGALSDGTKITVVLGRWWSVHISYSNGQPSLEL